MRVPPRMGMNGDGLRYIGRWPEQVSISDNQGGKDRDFWLVILQALGIFAILGVTGLVVVLSLWTLPPALWWAVLTACYFGAIVAGVIGSYLAVAWREPSTATRLGVAMLGIVILAASLRIFEVHIWEPLDKWTVDFFTAKLPVPNGWVLLALTLTGSSVLLFIARKYIQWMLAAGLASGGWVAAWLTVAWVKPTLHFYVALAVLNTALIIAAYFAVRRLKEEIMKPFFGSLEFEDEEEEKEEEPPRKQFIPVNARRGRALESIGYVIEVTGPKGEEWLLSERNLIAFVRGLPVRGITQDAWKGIKMPAGLVMYDQHGKVTQKDAAITQWAHWGPYYHFLMAHRIYDGKRFDSLFIDERGDPDPEAILEYLQLNGYARKEE